MSKLHPISSTRTDSYLFDVVFVHGLGGHWQSTWQNTKARFDWLEHVAKQHPSAKVWSLEHDATAIRPLGKTRGILQLIFRQDPHSGGASLALSERASQVTALMAQKGFGQRPIVWVGHSLGGLLIKHILCTAHTIGDENEKKITARSVAVMTLATPHNGADLANLGKMLSPLLNVTVNVEELAPEHPKLTELRDHYKKLGDHLETYSYAEKRPLAGVGLVVSVTSADPGSSRNQRTIVLEEDHLSIAKPVNSEDQQCEKLDQILSSIGNTQTPQENKSASPAAHPPSASEPPANMRARLDALLALLDRTPQRDALSEYLSSQQALDETKKFSTLCVLANCKTEDSPNVLSMLCLNSLLEDIQCLSNRKKLAYLGEAELQKPQAKKLCLSQSSLAKELNRLWSDFEDGEHWSIAQAHLEKPQDAVNVAEQFVRWRLSLPSDQRHPALLVLTTEKPVNQRIDKNLICVLPALKQVDWKDLEQWYQELAAARDPLESTIRQTLDAYPNREHQSGLALLDIEKYLVKKFDASPLGT